MWLGTAGGSVFQAQLSSPNPGQQPALKVVSSLDSGSCSTSSARPRSSAAQHTASSVSSSNQNLGPSPSGRAVPEGNYISHSLATPMIGSAVALLSASSPSRQCQSSQVPRIGSSSVPPFAKVGHAMSFEANNANKPPLELISAFGAQGKHGPTSLQQQHHASPYSHKSSQLLPTAQSWQGLLAHHGPVHEILMGSDRVVTKGGIGCSAVMREWTLSGQLVESHIPCKQGQPIQHILWPPWLSFHLAQQAIALRQACIAMVSAHLTICIMRCKSVLCSCLSTAPNF